MTKIEKQLKTIHKLAKLYYNSNPEHFKAVMEETAIALEQLEMDRLASIESLELAMEVETQEIDFASLTMDVA